jgi:hypothetical protein
MIVNGYKPLNDWYVLGAICFSMFFIGLIASQIFNPLPRHVREVQLELHNCQRETEQTCSIMVMPDGSQAEVYLLYSRYVK